LSYALRVRECCEVHEIPARQRRVLHAVLWINLVMFAIEAGGGLLARSTALFADSLDMLGDAIVYGFSLYVVARRGAGLDRAMHELAAQLRGLTVAAR